MMNFANFQRMSRNAYFVFRATSESVNLPLLIFDFVVSASNFLESFTNYMSIRELNKQIRIQINTLEKSISMIKQNLEYLDNVLHYKEQLRKNYEEIKEKHMEVLQKKYELNQKILDNKIEYLNKMHNIIENIKISMQILRENSLDNTEEYEKLKKIFYKNLSIYMDFAKRI